MRVLAVAQRRRALELHRQPRREGILGGLLRRLTRLSREVGVDGGVVARRALEHGHSQAAAGGVREPAALAQLGQHRVVVGGIRHHAHVGVVLGRGAEHRRAADVDLLDGVGQRDVGLRHGGLERVEVHHHQVDGLQLVLLEIRLVALVIAPSEQAAVDARVQRLHAAAEHLGATRQGLDVHHLEPGLAQRARGAAGGHQLDAELGQGAGELDEARLVGNGEQRPLDGTRLLGGHVKSPHTVGASVGWECLRGR